MRAHQAASAAALHAHAARQPDGPRTIPRFRDAPAHLEHAVARLLADLAVEAQVGLPARTVCPLSLCAQCTPAPSQDYCISATSTRGPQGAVSARLERRASARLAVSTSCRLPVSHP